MKKCIYYQEKMPKWSHIALCDHMKETTKIKRENVKEIIHKIDHKMNINHIFRDYNFLKAQEMTQNTEPR